MVSFRNEHPRARQAVEDQVANLLRPQACDYALRAENIRGCDNLHNSEPFGRHSLSLALVYHNRMPQHSSDGEGCRLAVVQRVGGAATDQAREDIFALFIEIDNASPGATA